MTNFHINRHSIENGEAILAIENGVLLEEQHVHEFNLPFIPEAWKARIQEIRVQHAESRMAAKVNGTNRRIGRFLIPHLH